MCYQSFKSRIDEKGPLIVKVNRESNIVEVTQNRLVIKNLGRIY